MFDQKLFDRCLLMIEQVQFGIPRRDVGQPIFLPELTTEAAIFATMEAEVLVRSIGIDAMTEFCQRLLNEPYVLLCDPSFCERIDRLKFVGRVWMLGNIVIVRTMVELAGLPYSILGEAGADIEKIRLPPEPFIDACRIAHRLMTGRGNYQERPIGRAFGISRRHDSASTGVEPLDQLGTISDLIGDDDPVAFRELLRTASPQLKDVLAAVLHMGAFVYGEYLNYVSSLNSLDGRASETADRSSQGGCLILLCSLACLGACVVGVVLQWL